VEPILIVSTATHDRIPGTSTEPEKILLGGPAHYLALALERLSAPFQILTNQGAEVEVVPTKTGEAYIIPALAPIELPRSLTGSAVVLSPIMREIDPKTVPPIEGLLVIDIQGFVREPGVRTDHATGPYDLAALLRRADLVKASEDELGLLDEKSCQALAETTVLATGGARGARLVRGREEVQIDVNRVDGVHTIGAGDIFLASMTYEMVRGEPAEKAAVVAARFTEVFLLERQSLGTP
jgi:sugar/nucleoside kinase (ribokinase family)